MRKPLYPFLFFLMLAVPFSAQATLFSDPVDIYKIGYTRTAPMTIGWTHNNDGSAYPEWGARLSIVAEGMDGARKHGPEIDTELTKSVFFPYLVWLKVGRNTVAVVVDPGKWIMEVETSLPDVKRFSKIPEPETFLLMAAGLFGLAALGRKRLLRK